MPSPTGIQIWFKGGVIKERFSINFMHICASISLFYKDKIYSAQFPNGFSPRGINVACYSKLKRSQPSLMELNERPRLMSRQNLVSFDLCERVDKTWIITPNKMHRRD